MNNKNNYKIIVLEAGAAGVSFAALAEFGELITYEYTPQELVAERISDADIVIPNKCILDESVLESATRVKLICEAATGYNNIDIEYCKSHDIVVTNSKGYSTEAVVQHTFALLFSVWEKLGYYSSYVNSGLYSAQDSFTHMGAPFRELYGKRLGIIGLGEIGRRVAQIATAFGMEVVYYSASGHTYDVEYEALGFDEFLRSCDIVSCHAPLNDKTRGLMNYQAFSMMKSEAVFLNLGRGPIVVEKDLIKALSEGIIAAAALDVFESEPIPSNSPLMKYIQSYMGEGNISDRLLLTPHMAWAPIEARERLVADVAESISAWIHGKPRSVVS